MKYRQFIAAALLALVTVLLCACGGQEELSLPAETQTLSTQPTTEPTQPKFSVETIRTQEFSDLEKISLYYDLACYMRYYDLMDAPEGKFSPYAPITLTDAAAYLSRATGQPIPVDSVEKQLTRGELAVLLQQAAEQLGLSTEAPNEEPDYPDFQEADQQASAALRWVLSEDLYRCFVGTRLLPNTVVSRLQFAQALIGLRALVNADELAAQISSALPERSGDSVTIANHDAIQAAVDAAGKKYGVAGMQVAVIEKGTVTDTFAYGWATKNTDPMTADHKLRIASISKVAVGITAQLLREEGVVDLDADISEYWDVKVKNPKYPDTPITLRSMLTHTSSITCYGDSTSRAYSSVKQKLQGPGFSSSVPGDIGYWIYNNYAFGVLGMTLELAADRLVDDILDQHLYTAMDIDAAFAGGELKNKDLIATLYRSGGDVARTAAKQQSMKSDPEPGSTGSYFAGGMMCSSYDLAKLISLLANDGRYEGVQLMEEESIRLMEERIEPATPGGSYQALPMRCWDDLYGRDTIYFHTGSAYGVFNAATYDPESRDGVVVLTTGGSGAKDEYGIYKSCAEINQFIYELLA